MDNQHRRITGYRELSQDEIDVMNLIKEKANQIGVLVELMEKTTEFGIDKRWLDIGKTQLQQGFMSLTRSVAKPESF